MCGGVTVLMHVAQGLWQCQTCIANTKENIPSDVRALGLWRGFDPPDLDRPGSQPHQQGRCEARLGCRDGSPQLGAPGPELERTVRNES